PTSTIKYWKCTLNEFSTEIHANLNDHVSIQFNTGLEARSQESKIILIQHRIETLGERYYDNIINAMAYLDSLSCIVA
ncbi:unnamed protein product, partial [Rotaria sp. Silwood1]